MSGPRRLVAPPRPPDAAKRRRRIHGELNSETSGVNRGRGEGNPQSQVRSLRAPPGEGRWTAQRHTAAPPHPGTGAPAADRATGGPTHLSGKTGKPGDRGHAGPRQVTAWLPRGGADGSPQDARRPFPDRRLENRDHGTSGGTGEMGRGGGSRRAMSGHCGNLTGRGDGRTAQSPSPLPIRIRGSSGPTGDNRGKYPVNGTGALRPAGTVGPWDGRIRKRARGHAPPPRH